MAIFNSKLLIYQRVSGKLECFTNPIYGYIEDNFPKPNHYSRLRSQGSVGILTQIYVILHQYYIPLHHVLSGDVPNPIIKKHH